MTEFAKFGYIIWVNAPHGLIQAESCVQYPIKLIGTLINKKKVLINDLIRNSIFESNVKKDDQKYSPLAFFDTKYLHSE